jgi:hypothetical protein
LAVAPPLDRAPHPVSFDVAYPERLSRLTTFFRIFLAIPQLIVVYLLFVAFWVLTVLAWFAILFTGRYPKAFFEFNSGVLRWGANVVAYLALLRDEYPPFSWEAGAYPLSLGIDPHERQSRWRLFIRYPAILPNQIVLYFVQLAWGVTTVVAWSAILLTGRYPRGLFDFGVGVMRWYQRQTAYFCMLREEYPPYSISANARPGNEVVSAILGVPLFVGMMALQFLPLFITGTSGSETVPVQAPLTSPALAAEAPNASANGIRLTLLAYNDDAPAPATSDGTLDVRYVSFRVAAEKDGFFPAFFFPFLLTLSTCDGGDYFAEEVSDGPGFKIFWRGGETEATLVYEVPRLATPCELTYQFIGKITFEFAGGV